MVFKDFLGLELRDGLLITLCHSVIEISIPNSVEYDYYIIQNFVKRFKNQKGGNGCTLLHFPNRS